MRVSPLAIVAASGALIIAGIGLLVSVSLAHPRKEPVRTELATRTAPQQQAQQPPPPLRAAPLADERAPLQVALALDVANRPGPDLAPSSTAPSLATAATVVAVAEDAPSPFVAPRDEPLYSIAPRAAPPIPATLSNPLGTPGTRTVGTAGTSTLGTSGTSTLGTSGTSTLGTSGPESQR